jgi:hypothetical protein
MGFRNYVLNSMASLSENSKIIRPWSLQLFFITILAYGYSDGEQENVKFASGLKGIMDQLAEVDDQV